MSATTRICNICTDEFPLDAEHFYPAKGYRDGFKPNCKGCYGKRAKGYTYKPLSEERRIKGRQRVKNNRDRNRRWAAEYLRSHPCVDCGETDIVVLEFDHVRGKKKNLNLMIHGTYSIKTIQAEIDKCDVVCVNCHRVRTAVSQAWGTSSGTAANTNASKMRRLRARNRAFVIDFLSSCSCVDCGVDDWRVLEFDHQGDKVANVSQLVSEAVALHRIEAEIAKCDVVCANCHRRRTTQEFSSYREAVA